MSKVSFFKPATYSEVVAIANFMLYTKMISH